MNILITGIHGFIGGNLVVALKSKYKLYGLDIVSPQKEGVIKTFGWNELEQLAQVDCIIHLAGKAHDTNNTTEEQVYFDINVGLTKTIFEKFLLSNAQKFIFFSSVKAVADTVQNDCLTENEMPHPGTAYGRSKLEAEQYLSTRLKEWQQNTGDNNKKLYILRPTMIHGPGNKGNLNLLYKLVSKGIPWPLGAFENKRSFASIDNLTFIINQFIEKQIEPGVYNLADDDALSTNRLIQLIAKSKGKNARILKIEKRWISSVAKLGEKLNLPLNSERLKKLTESYVVSNQKVKQAVGIASLPVDAEKGMTKTLDSFMKFNP